MPKWFGASRTIIVNILAAVVVILNSQEVISLFPPDATATIVSLLAVINVILRFLTSVPVTVLPSED